MVRDPWWLYAYWEIQPGTERAARSQLLPQEVVGLQSILRVHDVTGIDFPAQNAHQTFDISLSGLATNWYLHTNAPGRSFIVEIGLLTSPGRFLLLARSNRVTAPRFGPSDVIDELWMSTDDEYWKLFGVAGGVGMGSSAMEVRRVLEQKMFSPGLFSPGLFSPTKAPKDRRFGLAVHAELVLYGTTDSKARVSVQGQPIRVRPDGTFSLRVALPDGTQAIPVEAVSPDESEAKKVTSTVTRATQAESSGAQGGARSLARDSGTTAGSSEAR